MKPWAWLIFQAALALFAGGCAALRPQAPEVTLETVRLARASLREQHFDLVLRVKNPNDREFVMNALNYNIEVGGKPFAQGLSGEPVTLNASGDTLVRLPGIANLGNVFGTLLDGLLLGEVEYRVYGYADFEGIGRLPFDRKRKAAVGL